MDREKQEKLEKLLITREEAMALLGLKSRTMLNFYMKKKGLPYVKMGRKILRFPLKELLKWREKFEKTAA